MALYYESRKLSGTYPANFIVRLFTFGFIFSITSTAVLAKEFKGLSFDGSVLTYKCSVIGEGSTVWTGGGFDCPNSNNRITLINSAEYITAFGECNDDSNKIAARGVSVAGDHFTSKLYINYTPDLKGTNVTCIYDNGSVEVIIGTTPIVYNMVPEQTNSAVTVLAVIFAFVGFGVGLVLFLVFVGSCSRYRMKLHRPMLIASARSAPSHCKVSIDSEETTPLLSDSDSGEAIGTNLLDNDSTTIVKQERNPIQGEVHQSTYFSIAKETHHVPFLDHQILEIDFSGQEYTNMNHDFTLRIPEGAVAEGGKIHFEVGVAMYGPFIFPDNTQPISPILWLCILEGDAQLRKPFQIILPHYLTGLGSERIEYHQIRFAKANHSDYTYNINTQMSYKFHQCVTKPLLTSIGYRNYGVLVSKHCCFYCLTAQTSRELAIDAGYCLVRIESCISPQRNEFYFAAIYFLETCLKSLEEQFPCEERYQISRYESFKFKPTTDPDHEPYIQIIPAKNDQCIVGFEPLNAKIAASDIISFWNEKFEIMKRKHERNMYPPRVKMTVSINNPNHSITLPVKVLGCEGDDKLDVELTLPLSRPSPSPSSSFSGSHGSEPRSQAVLCGRPKLKDALKKLLPLATHWKIIGTLVGVSKPVLDKIKSNEEGADDRLQEMLSEWLKQIDPPPSWTALAEAVEAVDSSKAVEIRKHCLDMPIIS